MALPDKRVLIAMGDGDLLLSLGSLANRDPQAEQSRDSVRRQRAVGETGSQRTHTGHGTDLAAVAQGCGVPVVHKVATEAEIEPATRALRESNGPVFVLLKANGSPPL